MTEFQHLLVGAGINFILWHAFFKKYFITDKDVQTWNEIIMNWLRK